MPTRQPTISWQQLRNYMEQWTWKDPRTGVTVTGFNPPEKAKEKQQKPFYFRAVTLSGEVIEGSDVICLKVFLDSSQRLIKWPNGQCRRICDYLVMEVNGIRVVTH